MCQNLSKTLTPAADRLEPRGAAVLPPGGASMKAGLQEAVWPSSSELSTQISVGVRVFEYIQGPSKIHTANEIWAPGTHVQANFQPRIQSQ